MISRFNLGLIYAAITTVRKYYDCKKITIVMIGLFFLFSIAYEKETLGHKF